MKFNRTTVTREQFEQAGYVARTLVRGAGTYSNDEIYQTELKDKVWSVAMAGIRANDGSVRIEKKVLLKEVHIYVDAMFDSYRGTEIHRYLARPMSDEEWKQEQAKRNIICR